MMAEQGTSELLAAMAKALRSTATTTEWLRTLTEEDLQRAWDACPHAVALSRLCAPVTSSQVLVRAACACMHLAIERTYSRKPLEKAVRALEKWAEGAATWEEVHAAVARVWESLERDGGSSDLHGALYAAGDIRDDRTALEDVMECLALGLSNEGDVSIGGRPRLRPIKTRIQALAELVVVLRTVIPCPRLDDLVRAERTRPGDWRD